MKVEINELVKKYLTAYDVLAVVSSAGRITLVTGLYIEDRIETDGSFSNVASGIRYTVVLNSL